MERIWRSVRFLVLLSRASWRVTCRLHPSRINNVVSSRDRESSLPGQRSWGLHNRSQYEAASMILRIDDVVASEGEKGQPKPPGRPPGGVG